MKRNFTLSVLTCIPLFLLLMTSMSMGQACISAGCPNLISNGDFNNGNTGFSSHYTHQLNGPPSPTHYFISHDAYAVFDKWAAMSPDSSLFMMCDGDDLNSATAWKDSITGI